MGCVVPRWLCYECIEKKVGNLTIWEWTQIEKRTSKCEECGEMGSMYKFLVGKYKERK